MSINLCVWSEIHKGEKREREREAREKEESPRERET
jgi:hypothetical protein